MVFGDSESVLFIEVSQFQGSGSIVYQWAADLFNTSSSAKYMYIYITLLTKYRQRIGRWGLHMGEKEGSK